MGGLLVFVVSHQVTSLQTAVPPMFSTKQDQPDKPQVITNSQPSSVPFYRMDDRLFACEASMDSLHITSESDIFENVVCSCVVVKGRLRTNIDFWLGIIGSNWLLKVIREGYCLSFVDLPSKRFFRNHDTTLCNMQCVSSEISKLLLSRALTEVSATDLLVCNPLGVATGSSGKRRLIVDLRFVNQ